MDSNDEDGILLNLTKSTEEQPNSAGIKKITARVSKIRLRYYLMLDVLLSSTCAPYVKIQPWNW